MPRPHSGSVGELTMGYLSLRALWVVLYAIVFATPFNPLLDYAIAIVPYLVALAAAHSILLYLESQKNLANIGAARFSDSL